MNTLINRWNECFALAVTDWLKLNSTEEQIDAPENLAAYINPISESFSGEETIAVSLLWDLSHHSVSDKKQKDDNLPDDNGDTNATLPVDSVQQPWSGTVLLLASKTEIATLLSAVGVISSGNATEKDDLDEAAELTKRASSADLPDQWLGWIRAVAAAMPVTERPAKVDLVKQPQQGDISPCQLQIGKNQVRIGLIYELTIAGEAGSSRVGQNIDESEFNENPSFGGTSRRTGSVYSTGNQNLDLLLDVEVDASLRFGAREITIHELLETGPGDVLELDRNIYDPVDLIVGDKIVARGEVVLVNGNFGLRVTEVAEPRKCLESVRCLF